MYKLIAGTQEDAQAVVDFYNESIAQLSEDDAQAIAETYDRVVARGLDGKAWLMAIIEEVSKKREHKQTVGYIIGITRNRLNRGWGTLESEEEATLLELCKAKGFPLNHESIKHIYRLMGTHGALKTMMLLNSLSLEDIVTKALSEL